MLLFVEALYDAHSLVDGCDKDGDAGVVVASSPGALQCRKSSDLKVARAVGPKSNSPFDMYFVPIFAGFSAFSSWWYIVLSIDNIQQCQWPPFRTGRSPG